MRNMMNDLTNGMVMEQARALEARLRFLLVPDNFLGLGEARGYVNEAVTLKHGDELAAVVYVQPKRVSLFKPMFVYVPPHILMRVPHIPAYDPADRSKIVGVVPLFGEDLYD